MRPGTLVLLLVAQTAITIAAVAFLLATVGDRVDEELDRETSRIERQFERDVERLRQDVLEDLRRELDQRIPAQPGVTP